MLSSVLLGELRADVTNWWHKLVRQQQKSGTPSSSDSAAGSGGRGEPASSTQSKLSNETYTRLMTNGQELGSDMDRKSLQNLQFKNDQVSTRITQSQGCFNYLNYRIAIFCYFEWILFQSSHHIAQ